MENINKEYRRVDMNTVLNIALKENNLYMIKNSRF